MIVVINISKIFRNNLYMELSYIGFIFEVIKKRKNQKNWEKALIGFSKKSNS